MIFVGIASAVLLGSAGLASRQYLRSQPAKTEIQVPPGYLEKLMENWEK